jgi:hypothetical protein
MFQPDDLAAMRREHARFNGALRIRMPSDMQR